MLGSTYKHSSTLYILSCTRFHGILSFQRLRAGGYGAPGQLQSHGSDVQVVMTYDVWEHD